jgi:hypothetical protein
LTDGIAALWYILKFNLLVGVKESFRVVPGRAPHAFSEAEEVSEKPRAF